MGLIEGGDPAAFEAYLQQYGNTICGRHPIAVLLHVRLAAAVSAVCHVCVCVWCVWQAPAGWRRASCIARSPVALALPAGLCPARAVLCCAVQALKHCHTLQHHIRFTKYDQSHRCLTLRDSSVSYASAIVTIER